LDLARFDTTNSCRFASELNRATAQLLRTLPRPAQRWGLARKILNIFLRDCLYTTYLSEAYHLKRVERFLEVPLDSFTSKELRKAAGRGKLPSWLGVKKVTDKISPAYQDIATKEAKREKIARVHLDAKYWSLNRD
jgi:hypothetical protein